MPEAKEYICIVCPSSCRLTVTEQNGEITVTGHSCKRGVAHAESEYKNPVRMLTTTVAIGGGALPRLPVVGSAGVPKEKLEECLRVLYALQVQAPVQSGQVLLENICGTGVNVLAGRAMERKG